MEMSGFVVFIASIVISRMVNERAYRELDSETKVRLMDGFSKTRAYSMVPLLILIAAYWYLMTQVSANKQVLTAAYFGLLIAYVVIRSIMNRTKLSQLKMPAKYVRMFSLSQVISLLGVAWFFFALFYGK